MKDHLGNIAVIYSYQNASECYIRYIDGTEEGPYEFNKLMSHEFSKNSIHDTLKTERVGQKGTSAGGEEIIIADYITATDIDLMFVSDGALQKSTSYYRFKNNLILRSAAEKHVGEVYINRKGEHVRIMRWGGVRHIDVLIEETGETRTVKSFDNIKKGKVVSMASSEAKKKRLSERRSETGRVSKWRSSDIETQGTWM